MHLLTKAVTLAVHKHQSSNILTLLTWVIDALENSFLRTLRLSLNKRTWTGGGGLIQNKLTVGILSNTRLYSVEASFCTGNLSGNWLSWRKHNVLLHPYYTVNIFISSGALCRCSTQIAFCVFTNNLHWYKMKHEVYSYTTSLPGAGTNKVFPLFNKLLESFFDLCSPRSHYTAIYKVD